MARPKRNIVPRNDEGGFTRPLSDEEISAYMEAPQPPTAAPISPPASAEPPEEPAKAPRKPRKSKPVSRLQSDLHDEPASDDGIVVPKVPKKRYINLDANDPKSRLPRLTKKQKSDLEGWKHRDTRRQLLKNYMRAHADVARQKYGGGHGGVMIGSEAKNLTVGIPMPAFGWEYLTRQSVFPLGIVIQLVATWGTGKSGTVAEFLRWFDLAGGGGDYFENESKHSPEWFESIMGPEAYECLVLNCCDSIDDWQRRLTDTIDDHKWRMSGTKEKPGPGRNIPLLFAVDSVMGKLKEETQNKILEEGSAGRGHPIEALAITRYVQTMSSWLDGWPFSVVLVNHLKEKNDDKGHVFRSTAGGKHLNFQETFEIEMRVVGPKIDTVDFEGYHVEFEIMKNSLGGKNRRIRTRVLYWHEEDDNGDLKQRTVFDWDWTTVKLLADLLHSKDSRYTSPHLRALLKKIDFHIEIVKAGDTDNLAWSKSLGMSADSPLPWHEVGAMIRQDEDLLNRLRWALRIHTRPILSGDYLQQRNNLATEMP